MSEGQKSEAPKREEEILAFWKERKIFEKSLQKEAPKGEYVFYDGPPFATGLPHYGHIVASVIKDVVPRFWTMRGYHVPRVWGWDCHGLPIENIVEKELGFKHKKDILTMGIAKFNERCREQVLTYAHEWEKIIPRIGRWADMEHAYRTMDKPFMESVWWVFKQIYEKGLVYEDYRSMHICPRCETTLSQQEVSEGYKDVKDIAVTVKFELEDEPGTYLLAWTTTPWTLPGNVALAVNPEVVYAKFKWAGEYRIVAKDLLHKFPGEIIKEFPGKELVGKKYKPLFDYFSKDTTLKNRENGWKVYAADFITTDTGTGIAHEAPAFGADDWELAKKVNLPFVQHVNMDGTMKPEVRDFAGMEVKPKSDDDKVRLGTDIAVLKYLQEHDLLFSKENITHSYPHCWRCDTPLLNYATSSWFVSVTKIKDNLLKNAKAINWSPGHIKDGRWGKWLEGARDWSISRQRFWASVIPIWRCERCKAERVFGSAAELEEASGKKVNDLHKHIVDNITFPCSDCAKVGRDSKSPDARHGEAISGDVHGRTAEEIAGTHNEASGDFGRALMRRVPDVLDTWFDSGSMPYGERHYPFENKEKFDKAFPAQFIAEGLDQTRAWFYYLHVLAGALFKKNAFQNVIVNGIVLAEDGKKMSKKLQNYPDPMEVVEKYGADALRFYLLSSPVMQAENLSFSEKGVDEVARKNIGRLGNVLSFYQLYANDTKRGTESANVLDRWILARLNELIRESTEGYEKYQLDTATRPIAGFIDDLSVWYLRRSRDRFKEDNDDKKAALATLRYVLYTLATVMAPAMPFFAEHLYQTVKEGNDPESVHLASWPQPERRQPFFLRHLGLAWFSARDEDVIRHMRFVRWIVSRALELRDDAHIKVRQPLAVLEIPETPPLADDYLKVIADEVNVKKVIPKLSEIEVVLDINLTNELREEGFVRDIVRTIQEFRKTQNMRPGEPGTYVAKVSPEERVTIEKHRGYIQKATNTAIQFD